MAIVVGQGSIRARRWDHCTGRCICPTLHGKPAECICFIGRAAAEFLVINRVWTVCHLSPPTEYDRGNRPRVCWRFVPADRFRRSAAARSPLAGCRSEEHTSELQSHSDLVCRLLLEKKNENYGALSSDVQSD